MYNIGDEVEFWVVADYKDSKWCPRWQKGIVVDIYYYNLCITIRDQYGQVININTDQTSPIKKVRKTEKKQMKKSDLKNKMFVETREGKLYVVVDDILVGENGGFMMLSSFDKDLFCYTFGDHADTHDIMVVYEGNSFKSLRKELWSREVTKEMHFSNDLDFISDITDCLNDCKKHGAEKVTITFKMN